MITVYIEERRLFRFQSSSPVFA